MIKQPWMLPNINGFEFIGIVNHCEERRCRVIRDPETGTHYVDGEARYCDLTGWKEIPRGTNNE